jgi:hypothetical protein
MLLNVYSIQRRKMMTFMKRVCTLAVIVLVWTWMPVLAQQPGLDMMKQDHETGRTQPRRIRGKARIEMYQKLQEMQDHSKMMEGITDQQQLMREMKTHMRMVDTMTEQMMMLLYRGTARPQRGSGYQEHHSDLERKWMHDYRSITRPQQEPKDQEPHPGKSQ